MIDESEPGLQAAAVRGWLVLVLVAEPGPNKTGERSEENQSRVEEGES
jgi:hypothetical protein